MQDGSAGRERDHTGTARQGRDTGILQPLAWVGCSELLGMEH